jgi:ABC-type histidine transport system ATPase subunit
MAKLNQETLTIKVSQLLRDTDETKAILDADLVEQLAEIIQQLAGDKTLVEISRE